MWLVVNGQIMTNTAFVVFSNGIGGAERAVEKIVKNSVNQKSNSLLIVNSEIFDYFVNSLGERHVIDVGPLYLNNPLRVLLKKFIDFSIFFVFFKINRIRKILEDNNVDVIVSNLMYDLYVVYKLKLKNIKRIAVVHGLIGVSDDLPKFVFNPKYTRKMLLELDIVIAVSPIIENYLKDKNCNFTRIITTIENGVSENLPLNSMQNSSSGLRKFLFCGGTKKIKGGRLLYLVVKKMLESGRRFELTIAGPMENNSYWHELEKSFPENVIVVGFVTEYDLYNLISNQNFVLMPSISEGAPLVAFDAIKMKTPILASNIPAFQMYLSSEYLFQLTEEAMCEMISKAIDSDQFFKEYSFKFSPLTWAEVWVKYNQVINDD